MSSDSDNTDNEEMEAIIYTCRKCNDGKEFTKEQLDEHREMHRNQRKSKRRGNRRGSPAPSTNTAASLFSIAKEPPGPKSKKKARTGNARQARQATAVSNYQKNAPKMMDKKYNGA